MTHICDHLFASEQGNTDGKNLYIETYSNEAYDFRSSEPLQDEDDDYEWDEYGNLLDKYK